MPEDSEKSKTPYVQPPKPIEQERPSVPEQEPIIRDKSIRHQTEITSVVDPLEGPADASIDVPVSSDEGKGSSSGSTSSNNDEK